MTIDDQIEIQTFAMLDALHARLSSDPRTAGLTLPEGFSYEPLGSGQAHVRYGIGWYPQGGAHRRGTPPDEEVRAIPEAWDRSDPGAVDPAALASLETHAHRALRMTVQACAPFHAPTWAVLVHPALLALLLSHDPDRSVMPLGTMARDLDTTRRWVVDDMGNPSHTGANGTVATGECWMEKGVLRCSRMGVITPSLACVTIVSIPGLTRISMPGRLPETIMAADMVGMRLGDVASLPPSGDAAVDAAAADCAITSVEEMANGISLGLAQATLHAYAPAPDAVRARAMALAPEIG